MIRFTLVLVLLAIPPSVRPAVAQIFDESGAEEVVPRYDPDAEALRSLLVPGWSQMRQGADGYGTAYLMIAVVSAVFLSGAVEVPVLGDSDDNFGQVLAGAVYGLNAVVSAFDAHGRAVESNRENGWDLDRDAARGLRGPRLALVRLRF